jgi:integrase
MSEGTTAKRCYCRGEDGRQLGQKCPRLRRAGGGWSRHHGTWYYQLELPRKADGSRRRPLRRSGFDSQTDAEAELSRARELLAIADGDDPQVAVQIADLIQTTLARTRALPDPAVVRRKVRTRQELSSDLTVGQWLDDFLTRKRKIEPSTRRSYEAHIRLYFKPHLGHIRLDRLRVSDIAGMFEAIEEFNEVIEQARISGDPKLVAAVGLRRPVAPATMHRIRATLRHALNLAIKQERLIDFNPAAAVELPQATRPKPVVWTAEQVIRWQADYQQALTDQTTRPRGSGPRIRPFEVWLSTPRPSPVMVWTPAQTRVFLQHAAGHRLFAAYRLIALVGLRRGEACGLRWRDVDLHTGVLGICWQITQLGWQVIEGKPKTDASDRTVAIDAATVNVIHAHRARQDDERRAAGQAWQNSGFVFTTELGGRLHPQHLTDQFFTIAYQAGLPPIRLHDLRHGAASLMLAAGVNMKVVQETLGHTSSVFTADTYTSVFPQVAKAAADKTAALLDLAPPPPPTRTPPAPVHP